MRFSPDSALPCDSNSIHHSRPVSLYYQNIRGIRTKLNDFKLAVIENEYDIIVLTETWLTNDISSSEFINDQYVVFRKDRCQLSSGCTRGGGVLIAIRSNISSEQITLPCNEFNIEQLFVRVSSASGKSSLVICVSYIPPTSNLEIYSDHLRNIESLSTMLSDTDKICFLGDFNLSGISWVHMDDDTTLVPINVSSEIESTFIDCLTGLDLIQINGVCNFFNRFLDLIFVSNDILCRVNESLSPILKCDLHHKALNVSISFYNFSKLNSSKFHQVHNFKKANTESLNSYFSKIEWHKLLSNCSLEEAYGNFLEVFQVGLQSYVPLKDLTSKTSHPRWFNKSLLRLKNARNKAYKAYKRTGSDFNFNNFKRLRREYEFLHRFLYKQYLSSTERDIKNDSRSFWSYINNKRQCSVFPNIMEYNNIKSFNTKETCELFADFFESVYNDNVLFGDSTAFASCESIDIGSFLLTESDVEDAIKILDNNFSTDTDGISVFILKSCVSSLVSPLVLIFNLSLSGGYFLDSWKTSIIKPILKSGSKHLIANYRAVSLMNVVPKLLDCIVATKISFWCKEIICPEQHGFLSGKSTVTNLALFTNYCLSMMENGSQVDAIYTDFSKAFDKVNISVLIIKLQHMGFHANFLKWISSYLSNRKQIVVIDNVYSRSINALSGVPQGSHCGPILFLLFINDVVNCFSNARCLIYADDLKLFSEIRSLDCCFRLQQDLHNLSKWCSLNGLELNASKCRVMSYYRSLNHLEHLYSLSGSNLERVEVITDLGVVLDRKLSFSNHIDYISFKAFKTLGFIKRNSKEFSDIYTIKALYVSLVRPILEYASVIWTPIYTVHMNRIESVQKSFTRFLCFKLKFFKDSIPTYESRRLLVGLPKLQFHRNVNCALFIKDILCNSIKCPELLSSINLYAVERPLRTKKLLHAPYHRTNYGLNEVITKCINKFNFFNDFVDFTLPRSDFKSQIFLLENIK